MSFKKRTMLIVSIAVICLWAALFFAARETMIGSFTAADDNTTSVEGQSAGISGVHTNATRSIGELSRGLNRLATRFALIGLCFLGVTLLVLEKLTLRPIRRLVDGVIGACEGNRGTDPFQWTPRQEFAELGEMVHKVLGVLERSQRAHREDVRRFNSAIENTPLIAIQGVNREGIILSWNAESSRLSGHSRSEAQGNRLHELLLSPESAEEFQRDLARVWTTGSPVSAMERYIRTKEGSIRWVYFSILPLLKDGEVTEAICMQVDITDRKTAEGKIAQANEELQSMNEQLENTIRHAQQLAMEAQIANVAKSEFLARMSHEIRTPMNGIIGFTDMLLMTSMDEEQVEYAHIIKKSGETLLTLIDEILDFSKIEAGQMELESIDFNPASVAYDVCDLIRPRVHSKPIEVLCRISDRIPSCIQGDPARFRQVLLNLMGNAAKFTQEGEIEMAMDTDEETEARIRIHVTVRDTGIGIPPDKHGTIFEAFQQSGRFITRKYGGTGLGLAICRQLAHLMEGNVWVESIPGKKTIFHYTAWFLKRDEPVSTEVNLTSPRGKKILVVDDNATNLEIMQHLLGTAGARVVCVPTGEAALETLETALGEEDPFDLCILDIQMPGMSGYEVAQEIRRHPSPLSKMPLLAFSSSTNQTTEHFQRKGFTAFLSKPARPHKLMEMLSRVFEAQGAPLMEEAQGTHVNPSVSTDEDTSVRILLVEDNPANQKLGQLILAKAGYRVQVADNGREAINLFMASPEQFDLILMDVQMPEMDGLRATRTIRSRGFHDIPIVAMTANAMKGDREKCIEAGMNDYIAKPVRRESVYDMIGKWVMRKTELQP